MPLLNTKVVISHLMLDVLHLMSEGVEVSLPMPGEWVFLAELKHKH